MDPLYPGLNERVCDAMCAYVTAWCARWARLLFPAEWEGENNAVYLCTNEASCLHPIMGEKLPPPTKKHTLSSELHSLKSPEEGKQSGKKKKRAHSLLPKLPGARGSPGSEQVSLTTELCLDRNQRSTHWIGIQ